MNSILATEPTGAAAEKHDRPITLETWVSNERMRHIPRLEWIIAKVDGDLRTRIGQALRVVQSAAAAEDPRRGLLEDQLKSVCRALDRLADVAKHSRQNGLPPSDLSQRLDAALNHAVANLRSLDPDLIGRRFPFHTFERSRAEPLYGALLAAMQGVDRALATARGLDPDLDERLFGHLVVLQNPVDERMLRPIA